MDNTRIPKLAVRPRVLTSRRRSTSVNNLPNASSAILKRNDVTRRGVLGRRSRTAADLRPQLKASALCKNPLVKVQTQITKGPLLSTYRKPDVSLATIPTKRKAVASKEGVTNKENKLTKIQESKVVPPKPPPVAKPAPYDFKARFHLLKDKHIKVQADFSEISEKYKILQENSDAELNELRKDLKDRCKEVDELERNLKEVCNERDLLRLSVADLQVQNKEMKDQVTNLLESLNSQTSLVDGMRKSLQDADNNRRFLHNKIQDLKGNIRVFCRVRPTLNCEVGRTVIDFHYIDEATLGVNNSSISGSNRKGKHEFTFDRVFSSQASQEEVFDELAQLVESALDGYNVCVFAYGQTGSGKTFTMEGANTHESMGMIPRTVNLIFKSIEAKSILNWKFEVRASFLEIYNEQILDLLKDQKDSLKYEIRMTDDKRTDVFVTNQKIEIIQSGNELLYLLERAQQNRAVAATVMNACSSRSHSVTKIQLYGVNSTTNETCTGSLSLVDLAGSERARDSEVVRLNETKNINKSLSCLSNVILALSQKQEHIPYRDSKLTHLLMPSLGGNSKTLMVVNISPLIDCYNESLNSLRFASKVNNCKTGTIKRNKTVAPVPYFKE